MKNITTNKFANSIILLFAFGFILFSCKDLHVIPTPFDQNDLYECYVDNNLDSIQMIDELIGTWQWIFIESYTDPGNGVNTEDSEIKLKFENDSVLALLESDEVKLKTNWRIIENNSFFEIETDSTINQTWGRIIICNDKLIFNASYIDLADNYFIKTN